MTYTRWTNEIETEARDLLGQGLACAVVARRLGVAAVTIRRHVPEDMPWRTNGFVNRIGNIRNRVRVPTSIEDIVYMAAFIDAEGCITRNNNSWRISIDNTHQGVMEWFASFGGSPTRGFQPANPRAKRVWAWQVTSNLEVWRLLQVVMPYMKVKREWAMVAMADLDQRFSGVPLELLA